MKLLSLKVVTAAMLLIFCLSCKKDIPAPVEVETSKPFHTSLGMRSELSNENDTALVLTVLGNPRENPFHIDTMTRAYNLLFDTSVTKLPITHKYIKFTPGNAAEIEKLIESDLILMDFPLHYEIVRMGDYYLPHGYSLTTLPEYYTVVEPYEVLPNVPYEVIDELLLAPYASLLTYIAFQISGEEHEGLPGIGTPQIGENESCLDGLCADFLCCRFEGIDCLDEDIPDYCYYVTFDCNPWVIIGTEAWPDCLEIKVDYTEPAPQSGCSCDSYPGRHPAGCIRVEDTELPNNDNVEGQNRHMQGVDNVKVVWWDSWFTLKSSRTSEEGCWHIDHREHGKGYMWVVFSNDLVRVRSGLGTTMNIHYLFSAIKDYIGEFGGGTYNNIETNFLMWDINQRRSRAHRRWGAAHIVNGIVDYRDKADSDQINQPPLHMDVFLNMDDELFEFIDLTSNAPMFNHMSQNAIGTILNAGFFNLPFGNIIGTSFDLTLFPEIFWDVFINVNQRSSDRLYTTIYHEFSHASHFAAAGEEFWSNVIVFEVINLGWGTANSPGAEIIALVESWATHLGWTYAHERYGTNNSIFELTWISRLERTKNDRLDHIPIGYYHDLIDSAVDWGNICDDGNGNCQFVDDHISDVTNADIFRVLNSSNIASVSSFTEEIATELPPLPNNTLENLEDLFESY